MKIDSIVKNYKLNPDGSLRFVGTTIVKADGPNPGPQPLYIRSANGRTDIVYKKAPKRRGRPIDLARLGEGNSIFDTGIAQKIAAMQYDGTLGYDED